jgi:hypothetical protein
MQFSRACAQVNALVQYQYALPPLLYAVHPLSGGVQAAQPEPPQSIPVSSES